MKRMLIVSLIAITVCSVPVNAQSLTDGYFTFILPDQYEESSVNSYFYTSEKGSVLFDTLDSSGIDTEDEFKSYLEAFGHSFTTTSYSYTISYGTKSGMHYIKYHGFDDKGMIDFLAVATEEQGLTVYCLNAADAAESIFNSILISTE